MPLRGKKPAEIAKDKRLKMFIFGQAKAGKTTASIGFPAPYLIDTEKGAENKKYTDLLEKNGGAIFQSSDFDEIVSELLALNSEKHNYKTVIIDPITTVYDVLLEQSAEDVGIKFGRHYGLANKKMKTLIQILLRLDMNVILTAHSKPEYSDDLTVLGHTFDGYKKLDYLFDLILYAERRGKRRVAVVKGSRMLGFEEDDAFDLSYAEIAKRYSKDLMEKDSDQVDLADKDTLDTLNSMIKTYKIDSVLTQKWLDKAGVMSFNQMLQSDLVKIVDFLKNKFQPKGV